MSQRTKRPSTTEEPLSTLGVYSSRPELRTHSSSVIRDYIARQTEDIYPPILERLDDATRRQWLLEKTLQDSGFVSKDNTALLSLEKILLDMAAYRDVAQGIFLAICFKHNGTRYIRFFEGGSYIGFLHSQGRTTLTGNDAPAYRVYTVEDIAKRRQFIEKRAESYKRPAEPDGVKKKKPRVYNRTGEKYRQLLSRCQADLRIIQLKSGDEAVQNDIPLQFYFLQTLRSNPCPQRSVDRYTHCWGISVATQKKMEEELSNFRIHGSPSFPFHQIDDLYNLDIPLSISDQFDVLSALTNYHWGVIPVVRNTRLRSFSSKVGYEHQLAYQPDVTDKEHPYMLPTSPRNRLIYFSNSERYEKSEIQTVLNYIFRSDTTSLANDTETAGDTTHPRDLPRNTRRYTPRIYKVTPELLEVSMGKHSSDRNMTVQVLNTYDHFRTKLIEQGNIQWRLHSADMNVLAMNDYSADTGALLPQSFVHVQMLPQGQDFVYSCSCTIYGIIISLASVHANGDVLPDTTTCMHCRFLKDDVAPHMESLFTNCAATSSLMLKLKRSLHSVNESAVKMSEDPGVLKFSVKLSYADSPCSFVHLSNNGLMMTCLNGECQAKGLKHKRSVKKLLSLGEASTLCPHIEAMCAQRELWTPDVGSEDSPEDDVCIDHVQQADSVNAEDADLHQTNYGASFCPQNGKWDFGGHSAHKPCRNYDLNLSRNIRKRHVINDLNVETPRDISSGCLTGVKLVPQLKESPACACGAGFKSPSIPDGKEPIFDYKTTLYMRHAPAKCEVFYRPCLGEAPCMMRYSGEQDGIHFWTKETCAGDEIGWDFCNKVLACKMSFTAFCKETTRIYSSYKPISAAFMSKTTFVSWFFSWAGRMEIDFRQHADPWCSPSPKVLACDGTHVGLILRNLNIKPIDLPTVQVEVNAEHKRYDRVFLYYRTGVSDDDIRDGRRHLLYMCKKFLCRLDTSEIVEEEILNASTARLLGIFSENEACRRMLTDFLRGSYPPELKRSLSDILLMLARDAPVSTVIPFRYLGILSQVCQSVLQGQRDVISVKSFAPEVYRVLKAAFNTDHSDDICRFIIYLIDFVKGVHSHDRPYPAASPIPNSYNPEEGVAYYFTAHGNRVRNMPTYNIQGNKNYDDNPCVEERCEKRYTKVSVGGWSHLFLWFCPMHGHCFGFHIISGPEGRKDPFASAYKYLEDPPEEVFYDFACSLSEYSLNREPSFWRNTRFWHDLFHGFSHKCGNNFKSSRIASLDGYNSEICEQFNAFIQCIKYTGTHLTQAHFCFFVQFMVYIWNERKTEIFTRRVNIALEGFQI